MTWCLPTAVRPCAGCRTVAAISDPASGEIHGVGETLVPPVAAAIGCAVADAINVRLHDLPMTPERILQALRGGPRPS